MRTFSLSLSLGLFLALPLVSASSGAQDHLLPEPPDGFCLGARLEKKQAFRSYGQIASDGIDMAEYGKFLKLEMHELPDIGYTEISVIGAPKGMPSIVLVGARQIETRLPWGDTLLVGDIVGAFFLPGDTSSILIDLNAIERPLEGSLKIYIQAFSYDGELPYPLTSSNGLEISLSYEEVIDYNGPRITSELFSTDSIVPIWSIEIFAEVSGNTHALSFDSISRDKDVTRVYVSLKVLDAANIDNPYLPLIIQPRAKLHVELGSDVAERIEIWVSEGGHHNDGTPCYALAHSTWRRL